MEESSNKSTALDYVIGGIKYGAAVVAVITTSGCLGPESICHNETINPNSDIIQKTGIVEIIGKEALKKNKTIESTFFSPQGTGYVGVDLMFKELELSFSAYDNSPSYNPDGKVDDAYLETILNRRLHCEIRVALVALSTDKRFKVKVDGDSHWESLRAYHGSGSDTSLGAVAQKVFDYSVEQAVKKAEWDPHVKHYKTWRKDIKSGRGHFRR